jgi:hypothetical protein
MHVSLVSTAENVRSAGAPGQPVSGLVSWRGELGGQVDTFVALGAECYLEMPDGRRGSVVVTGTGGNVVGSGPPPFD